MKYVYPVIFEEDDGKIGVTVPDIPSTFTYGDDMADAIYMAQDVIAMMLADYEDTNKEIPAPSKIEDIKTKGIVSLVVADTDGQVVKVTGEEIWIKDKAGKLHKYQLMKYQFPQFFPEIADRSTTERRFLHKTDH